MNLFQTDYGYFNAEDNEYVITRSDTPRPWVNVISNGDYGFIISQTGGGYSWRTHGKLNRLTRWDQDLIRDDWGKYLYIRDNDSGDFWSATWKPVCRQPDRYECHHGLGYTTIISLNAGLESAVTFFAPRDEPLELWSIKLINRSDRPRRLSLSSYFEWLLGAAPDWHREFHKLFIDTRYDSSLGAIVATKRIWELPVSAGAGWNRSWEYTAFHAASPQPAAFEADKEAFIGMYGSLQKPQAVVQGHSAQRAGRWTDPIGSLRIDVELNPGEEKTVTLMLGAVTDAAEIETLVTRYRDPAAVEAALRSVKTFWREFSAPLHVQTPDPAFDLMTNTWLKYQTVSGRLWGRSGYYQPDGAFGFRDQLQDSQVYLLLDRSDLTLKQIRLHARHQFKDGTVYHWWHPLAETGAITNMTDDLLWLPFVVNNYLKETADLTVLDHVEPFVDGDAASLYEHCQRAIERVLLRFSPRGLPLIGDGDWNDGLNAVGRQMKGESIWLGHFLHYILNEFAAIADRRGDAPTVARYQARAEELKANINRYAWDGEWYIRATDDEGRVLGSQQCVAGKIFLNAQTWSVIGGTAPAERAAAAMGALERLLDRDYGPLLLYPAYTQPDTRIGYLTRYAPGTRENGGVYTHAGTWAVWAECLLKRGDVAYNMYRKMCPVYRGLNPTLYQAEPYVLPGNVDGPASTFFGRGGWTWYTGSAGWMLRVGIEAILGVRPVYDGLLIDPCIPAEWDGFTIKRSFRGAVYEIEVTNPQHVSSGVSEIVVDGQPHAGKVIPAFADGKTHTIKVTLSSAS